MSIVRIFLAALLLLAVPTGSLALSFFDINDNEAEAAIEVLAERGYVEGFRDGTFRPNDGINRAEMLTILMNIRSKKTDMPRDLRCFLDLEQKTPQWYARPVCLARELGIVRGYDDGTFRPGKFVTLAEALKMSFLAFDILPSISDGAWYEPYLLLARDRGILVPLLKYPGQTITRGEMATIAAMLLREREERDAPQTVSGGSECGNEKVEGLEQCDDGNTKDGDGCSSICILVPEPLRMAFLQIDETMSAVATNVVRGQQNVPLLRFTAVADRQDALLTSVTFAPRVGNLLFATHYTLSMDRDGDGRYEQVIQTNGRTEGSRLIFDAMENGGVWIPKNLRVPFLVSADMATIPGAVGLGITFAVTEPGYVEAQGLTDGLSLPGIETNGVCSAANCFIRVNTGNAITLTSVERGSLFVNQSSLPVRSHILLGGSRTDTLLRLTLRAEGEAVDLKQIAFDGVPSSVESLLLLRGGSTEPFAVASSGQCTNQPATRFCAVLPLSTFVIPSGETLVVNVAASMKTDQMGGVSGQTASLSVASTTGDNHAVEARGMSSQQNLAQNDEDGIYDGEIVIGAETPIANTAITAPLHDVSFATLSSIVRSGQAEEHVIPVGYAPIGRFTFASSPHSNSAGGSNDVILKTLTFHVSAQNVQIDPASFRLANEAHPSLSLPCSAAATTGQFDVTCSSIDSGTIASHIGQGNTATYRLSAHITNPAITSATSILTVSLGTTGQRGVTNSVQWSDGVTTFSWVDIPETSVMGTVYR